MGWSTGNRAMVTAAQMKWETVNGFEVVAIQHHREGDEDWYLYEVRNKQTGAAKERFIGLTVWDGRLHKEMEEAVGPYYYGVPVDWLDHVPVPGDNPWCIKWREQVQAKAASLAGGVK